MKIMDDTGLICQICGENEFTVKEGFYYCNECGTQTQSIRDIVYERDEQTDGLYQSKLKIKTIKSEKQELTSWECFNYLIRGLVEELLELGAKEELRKVVLQLWTYYLRITEVAFFNKKQTELPKLGPRYSIRDAKILYNQSIVKNRKKRKSHDTELSKKAIHKQKHKFMESEYEKSQSEQTSSYRTTLTSYSSSTSMATTARAIKLTFTTMARKYYKKNMNLSHLRKHEFDSKNELNCHRLNKAPKLNAISSNSRLSRKTIYTILYIALNLIEDDIQLSDLLRFMNEGHLSSTNIMHLFPDEIALNCEKVIKSKIFYSRRDIFLDISLRVHTAFLCRLMNINELKIPNIHNLISRYVYDLNLPESITIFIHRLINLCPEQKIPLKLEHCISPFYEARAMAFIIFVLKLLFGLDDKKEHLISESARNINKELEDIGFSKDKKLFIWDDWVKFIEMRKIILSQCHLPTAIQSKQLIKQDQYINQYKIDDNLEDTIIKINSIERNTRLHNLQNIFESYQIKHENHLYKNDNNLNDKISSLKFSPSLTPNRSYFDELLKIKKENLYIPDFMYEDHSKFDIKTFVKETNLKRYLSMKKIKLNINRISCKSEHNYIGIFKYYDLLEDYKYRDIIARKIKYDIDENEWIEKISEIEKKSNIIEISANKMKSKSVKIINNKKKKEINYSKNSLMNSNDNNIENMSIKSFDIFSEMDMNPYDENFFREPRRNLDIENIFNELSDDDDDDQNSVDENNESDNNKFIKCLDLNLSNFDYWIIFGKYNKLNDKYLTQIKNELPKNYLWLLNTCANLLGIDWNYLFKEIIIVENYFSNVLEPFDNVTSILKFQTEYKSSDMEKIVKDYKDLW